MPDARPAGRPRRAARPRQRWPPGSRCRTPHGSRQGRVALERPRGPPPHGGGFIGQLLPRADQDDLRIAAGQCTEHCTLLSALGGLPVPSRPKVVEPPAGMAPSEPALATLTPAPDWAQVPFHI